MICVDFDNTIYDGLKIIDGCVAALTRLRRDHKIAIFSARATEAEREQMRRILDEGHVPYDEILPRKPDAIIYIDDKGWKFTSWDSIPL